MADLGTFLASAPIRQAYLERSQQNEAQPMQQIQQAGALQTLLAHAGAAQRDAQARQIIDSGAPPDQVFAALSKVSPEHAQKYAAGLKEMQALKMSEAAQRALQGENGTPQTDPATLRKVAQVMIAAGHPGGAPLLAEAQRRQNEVDRVAQLREMRGTPAIAPDPQEVSQAADSGQQPPQTVPAKPGIGEDLLSSSDPSIAASAKNIRLQIANAGPSAKPEMYQAAINNLYLRQAALDRAKNAAADRQEPLVAVVGKDGKPVMLPRSQAVGLAPASSAKDPATMLDKDALETAGWEKLLFGTDAKGFGKASSEQRTQIASERTRIGKGLGLSPMEIAMMPQDNKVKMKAVDALTKWGAFVDKGAEQLIPSIDLAISYAQKLDPTKLQTLNKGILAGRTEFNDPQANAYAVAVNTVRREYGRLMSGPTSNAMLPVEAMKQGDHLISTALDVPAWNEVKNVILQDAGFTKAAVKKQIDTLRSSMLPPGAAPATPAPTAPAAAPAAAPPADATWTPEKEKRYQELLKKRGGS